MQAKTFFVALALAFVGTLPAPAQDRYPSKPITIVTPITAGTTIDILARLFADGLSKKFGQQVIVLIRRAPAESLPHRRSRTPPLMAIPFFSRIPDMSFWAR